MGLFDWLSEGLGNLGGADIGGAPPPQMPPQMPPVQQTGSDQPQLQARSIPPSPQPPLNYQRPEFARARPPEVDPSTSDIAGGMTGAAPAGYAQGGDPMGSAPNGPGLPPPAPYPQGGDPMADSVQRNGPGLPPPQVSGGSPPRPPITMNEPANNPGPPMQLGPGLGVGAPPPSSGGVSWLPDQQGNNGLLRAIGASPDQANRLRAGFGAGLTAAGNSAGKSPFQALASGAGATMEGGSKEAHQNTKDAQGWLAQAIASKKAGDDAGYKTNYMKYLYDELKANQEKAASKDAASKNDSPTQLYLSANRLVQADGDVKAASRALMDARKSGTPEEALKAQTALQQIIAQKQQEHYAALGLHPQTAAQLAQQPGMSQANPVDAGTAGITKDNIAKKLQPGQYYKNPTDGKVYLYKGPNGGADSKPGKPKPADPMKPERGTMPRTAALAGADAEAE